MSCNPTRILLSNSGTTTMQVTVDPTPSPEVDVTFQVDELGVNRTATTSSGVATFVLDAVIATNNSIWDATLQIGSNMRAAASVQAVETNGSTSIGVTVSSGEVTYCAPTAGGGGTGTVTGVTGVTPISVTASATTPEVSLDNDGITTAKIADDAVTSPKIADDAVTHGKIADLAVEHGKIGLGAVQTTNINDDAVTADKLADTLVTPGSYTTADITVDAQGRITFASTGSPPAGTVTSVTAGSGLTGGTITSTGTIAHQAQPASGTGPAFVKSVEIDSFGHVTSVVGEATAAAYRTETGTDDAANLTTGVLDVARVPDLDAAKITTGTIAAARLPAVSDSYTGQIETADNKTYTIDPAVVAARTITSFYARSGSGTCTATLKNNTATVGVVNVTTNSTNALVSNPNVASGDPITIVVTSNGSATDVVFSVEFTQ